MKQIFGGKYLNIIFQSLIILSGLFSTQYLSTAIEIEKDLSLEDTRGHPIRVTCIGDSITAGGTCSGTNSYVEILQSLLGKSFFLTNAGKSGMTQLKKGYCGSTKENAHPGCSYWDTDAWQHALTSKPDIVTIMLGTNDAKAFNWNKNADHNFASDYVSMVKTLRQLQPVPQIFIMTSPPLYEPFPFSMNPTVINNTYSTLIRDIVDDTDTHLIDIFSAMIKNSKKKLTCDGCHPNADGNQIIAEAMYPVIRKAAVQK